MLCFSSPYSESIEFDKSIDSHNKSRDLCCVLSLDGNRVRNKIIKKNLVHLFFKINLKFM